MILYYQTQNYGNNYKVSYGDRVNLPPHLKFTLFRANLLRALSVYL